MTIEITKTELKILEEAMMFLHSHYVMQSVRSRSYSKKHINYRDARKREERITELREKHSASANKVYELMGNIHNQTN